MAIMKTFVLKDNFMEDVTFVNCYAKVGRIEGGKNGLSFSLEIKRSAEAPSAIITNYYVFAPDLSGENFIAQAYAHLKTLPEFADATDC